MKKKYLWCFLIFFGKLRLHFSKFFSFFCYGGYCISTNFI